MLSGTSPSDVQAASQVSATNTVRFAPETAIATELAKSLSKVCSCFDATLSVICKKELLAPETGQLAQVVKCARNMDTPLGETNLTPLWLAASRGETAAVERILLHENLDPNAKSNGETALHVALRMQNRGAVDVLLNDPRIDTAVTNDKGRTAIEEAAERGHVRMVNQMASHPKAGIDNAEYARLMMRASEKQIALSNHIFERRERIADFDRQRGHDS